MVTEWDFTQANWCAVACMKVQLLGADKQCRNKQTEEPGYTVQKTFLIA